MIPLLRTGLDLLDAAIKKVLKTMPVNVINIGNLNYSSGSGSIGFGFILGFIFAFAIMSRSPQVSLPQIQDPILKEQQGGEFLPPAKSKPSYVAEKGCSYNEVDNESAESQGVDNKIEQYVSAEESSC